MDVMLMDSDDDEDYIDQLLDEEITFALVLKLTGSQVKNLNQYLGNNNMNIIYKTFSYGPLFISKQKHDDP
jgi:hypothetical protein